ncbi:MAG: cobalt-precorrin-7 (C(5))-methyltransferase [Desulfonauticus sp.]|nr:cobalt-precorrin-7 (C(5))-methyltransferase [Desulfonauticus sp.]
MVDNSSKLFILGCGPGSPDYVLPVVRKLVLEQEVLLGSKRLLDLFPEFKGRKKEILLPLEKTISFLESICFKSKCAILVSGSPLRFSLGEKILRHFGKDKCVVVPGVSAADVGLAKLGIVNKGVGYFSVHGRNSSFLPSSFQCYQTVVFFLGKDWQWLKKHLWLDKYFSFFYLENLTLEQERIVKYVSFASPPPILGPALLIGVRRAFFD